MDFFQTIFKTNISLSGIFENYIIKGLGAGMTESKLNQSKVPLPTRLGLMS